MGGEFGVGRRAENMANRNQLSCTPEVGVDPALPNPLVKFPLIAS